MYYLDLRSGRIGLFISGCSEGWGYTGACHAMHTSISFLTFLKEQTCVKILIGLMSWHFFNLMIHLQVGFRLSDKIAI